MAKMRWRTYPLDATASGEITVYVIDGVSAELVVTNMGDEDQVDGMSQRNMMLKGNEAGVVVPYRRRWPVVRDRSGNPLRYNDRLTVLNRDESVFGTLTIYYYDEGL